MAFPAMKTNTFLCVMLALASLWRVNSHQWPNHGGGLTNQRNAINETKISPLSVSRLVLKWKFYAGLDITATPAIDERFVYFPSWNGFLYAVRFEDGVLQWKVNLTAVTGQNSMIFSRSTPVIACDLVIASIYGPAILVAFQRYTGKLVWISQELDPGPLAVIPMSGTAFDGSLYIGISSAQELYEESCCTFQGSFQKIDLRTGKMIWRTSMLPPNAGTKGGYTGVAIWGSSPSIDIKRCLVYIATGNLYTAPTQVQQCEGTNKNRTIPISPDPCLPSNVHQESVLALHMETGKIKWSKRLGEFDVWTYTCATNPSPNCPAKLGEDYDFGEAPMLLSIEASRLSRRDILVVGQKSGIVWALDRNIGDVVWDTVAGPGGIVGGAIWGAATDGRVVYTNIANSDKKDFMLIPSSVTTKSGGWVALDAVTGRTLWSAANPTGALSAGPVSIANGVLFAGSFDQKGHVYALDGRTGSVLWSYVTNASVYGGFSISRGCAFVGSGYGASSIGQVLGGTIGDSLFAFCLPLCD